MHHNLILLYILLLSIKTSFIAIYCVWGRDPIYRVRGGAVGSVVAQGDCVQCTIISYYYIYCYYPSKPPLSQFIACGVGTRFIASVGARWGPWLPRVIACNAP